MKVSKFASAVTNVIILTMLLTLTLVSFTGQYSSFVFTQSNDRPYYKGNTTRNEVALMINVYWGTEYLDGMLDILANHNAKATFFVGGSWAAKNKEYLDKIIEGGHELGNHGYFHKDHAKLNAQQNEAEITSTNTLVKGLTGYDLTLFAPPSGSLVYSRATNKIGAGDMILMHPTAHTLAALGDILKYYENNNLKPVTVSQIISKEII